MESLAETLQRYANKEKSLVLERFFKTGKGEYGEGDLFLGITVPVLRSIAKQYHSLSLDDVEHHLSSKYHEERLVALLILVEKFKTSWTVGEQQLIADFYLSHTSRVNNWDLVDLSAYQILGEHLFEKNKNILDRLASSKNLWERRIAIVATFAFIRKERFEETLRISTRLLDDNHDLIHKACGWMLREVGKRDESTLKKYLDEYARKMPRTMLRYAIERLSKEQQKRYRNEK